MIHGLGAGFTICAPFQVALEIALAIFTVSDSQLPRS